MEKVTGDNDFLICISCFTIFKSPFSSSMAT
jgi:hypothetical protein